MDDIKSDFDQNKMQTQDLIPAVATHLNQNLYNILSIAGLYVGQGHMNKM